MRKILWQPWGVRFFHWVFAISVMIMLVTGFYIAFPSEGMWFLDINTARFLKSSSAFIAMGAWVGRIYYGIAGGNLVDMLFKWGDWWEFKETIKYYLYFRPKLPHHAKYNAAQRFIFSSWYVLYPVIFITGLILFSPNVWLKYSPILPIQTVRAFHFLLALWYLGTSPVHIYLAVSQDPAKLQAIFSGWVQKK